MRARIISWTLSASALVALLAPQAEAQNRSRVKIIRGTALAQAAAEPSAPAPEPDPLSDQAADPWTSTEHDSEEDGSEEHDSEESLLDSSTDWGTDQSSSCACGADHGSCELQGCDATGADCACIRPYGLAAGVEATYLRPTYQRLDNGFDLSPDYRAEAAPRIWLQWQTQTGWGIRGRYWQLDAQQERSTTFNEPETVGVVSFDDDLDLYAVDLELTRTFYIQRTEFCASFGARNGRLHHNVTQHFSIFDLAGGGGDDATAVLQEIDRDLNGTGFTTAIGMRRPIGNSRLAAICNLRGSVLWGGNDLSANGTLIEVVPVGAGDLDLNDFQDFSAFGSNGAGMWIGEVQAGGEWNTPLSSDFGGGNAFLRILFEGQWWTLPGANATGDQPLSTESQLYQFVGLTAAVGFTR